VYTAPFVFPGYEIVRWIVFFVLINQVTMCGQKGPLELPERSTLKTMPVATGAECVAAN